MPPEASEKGSPELLILRTFALNQAEELVRFLSEAEKAGHKTALALEPTDLDGSLGEVLKDHQGQAPIITLSGTHEFGHPTAAYRVLAAHLRQLNLPFPIWIRSSDEARINPEEDLFSSRLLDSAILVGSLLCDGIGDLLSVDNAPDSNRSRALAYNLLQGARARSSKTEFVACPSCGRTLFDLQSTTQRVKESTSHLKGVTIAVMGCIVNGPGEMADADFGYVGSAPGKIDLYVGKNRVKSAISEKEAVDRLVRLIKEEGKWTEP
jgi:(E)-4-hydroxy-3-methylbut-2-enyl-diphosphate synthase